MAALLRWSVTLQASFLVHKALHGQLPQYLAEDCQVLTKIGGRSLRSADVLTCATHKRVSVTGVFLSLDRVSGTLPVALRDRDISLVQFKRLLKTLWFV